MLRHFLQLVQTLCFHITLFVRAVLKISVDLRGTAQLVLILNGLLIPSNPSSRKHWHFFFSTGNAKIKKNPDQCSFQ